MSSPPLDGGALRFKDEAWGRRFIRPGFAFTEEDDLAFALGWPSYVTLVPGDPGNEDPAAHAERLLEEDYPFLELTYPAEAAARLVRVLRVPNQFDFETVPGEKLLLPAAREALARPGPISEEEATQLLLEYSTGRFRSSFLGGALVRLCEAFVGPQIVMETMTRALEQLAGTEPGNWYHELDAMGSMLLRLPAKESAEARVRLRQALAALPTLPDCVVLGAAGTNAHNMPQQVLDDPDFVREARLARAEPWGDVPNPRLVFLGGERVYEAELGYWRRYGFYPAGKTHRMIIERFGVIRSAHTVRLVSEMRQRSRAKRLAREWLRKHADYAEPILEELAARGEAGPGT